MNKLLLLLLLIISLPFAGQSQCTTNNATTCVCKNGGINCDLLPDIIVGKPPLLAGGNNGVVEYPQVCNPPCSGNDGRLRISVSTPNIGFGPLEVRALPTAICGTDTFYNVASNFVCPNGANLKQLVNQRVYQKNGNTMTYYDRYAGTMTYHPTHGHMHVDNWGAYSLRSATADPNPLNWPILGTGTKLAFCLMDYGTCSYYNGHCVDSLGNTLLNSNFANYGLGGGAYNCSPSVQGISSGYADIYYQYLDGMWINLPPGLCNGQYWIVIQLDPLNYFLESNENNNVLAVPVTLTKQNGVLPVITANGPTTFCKGGSVVLTASAATSYQWSTGDTTQSITVSQSGKYAVRVNGSSACPAGSDSITVTVNPVTVNASATPSVICTTSPVKLSASATSGGYLNQTATFTNNTAVAIPDNNPVGITSSINVSGLNPTALNANSVVSVVININHTYDADLLVQLISPSGSAINLVNRRGGSGDNFVNTTFMTNTTYSISNTGTPPFNGNFMPEGPFSALVGNINGTWTLKVVDLDPQDTGSLINWTLNLNNQIPTTLSYSWTSNPPGFTASGTSATVSPTTTTTYTVTAVESGTGCTGNTSITVNMNSGIAITANTPPPVCPGSNTTLTASGAVNYTWSPSTYLNAVTGSSVISTPVQNTTYTVTGTDSYGCSGSTTVSVTMAIPPAISVSLDTTICKGKTANLSAGGAVSYQWLPSSSLNTSSGAQVSASPIQNTLYTVTGTDANGCTGLAQVMVSVNDVPGTPGIISGKPALCVGNTTTFIINPLTNTTSYTWTVPSSLTILSGQGTNVLTVKATTAGTGSLCVTANNDCGSSQPSCLNISVNSAAPAQPSIISGAAKVCPGDQVTYSVTPMTTADSYNWTIPANTTIVNGQGTNALTLLFNSGFTGGDVLVSASNACSTGSTRKKTLSLNMPASPTSMSGPITGVCNSTKTYAVPSVNGMTYNWTVPAGASIVSGQGTHSINVAFGNSVPSGNIAVTASNACGTSVARIKTVKGSPAIPGTITGSVSVCTGQQGIVYSIAPVAGATTYNWIVPSGSVIISGQGTTGITVNAGTTAKTGNVSVNASNDCGTSSRKTLAVTINSCVKIDNQEMPEENDLSVLPNPANDYVQILYNADNNAGNGRLKISNILGQEQYSQQANITKGINSFMIDLRKLPVGIYLLTLEQEGHSYTRRLIVDR